MRPEYLRAHAHTRNIRSHAHPENSGSIHTLYASKGIHTSTRHAFLTSLLRCSCPAAGGANGVASNGVDSNVERIVCGSLSAAFMGLRDEKKPFMHMRVLSLCTCVVLDCTCGGMICDYKREYMEKCEKKLVFHMRVLSLCTCIVCDAIELHVWRHDM